MKKLYFLPMLLLCAATFMSFTACGNENDNPLAPSDTESSSNNDENTDNKMEEYTMNILVNGHTLKAKMVANSSAEALKNLLQQGNLTLQMHDYANFEKVGSLGHTLPTNDTQITTSAGDLILYQGNQFVIYYDTNSWNFTRLGKIEGVSQSELKNILGTGDVSVVLSLTE